VTFDTRGKVVTVEQAARLARDQRSGGMLVVAFVTHLEVLRAAQVRKLEQVAEVAGREGGKLFVILTEPESPLVPLAARAELAAGLRAVDYVVAASEGGVAALAAIAPDVTIQDEAEDRRLTRELIEHVRATSRV
jgi:hypothetical protein